MGQSRNKILKKRTFYKGNISSFYSIDVFVVNRFRY